MEMREISEKLLRSWIRLYSSMKNGRIVTDMTFNEAYICNLLIASKGVTATYLCKETGILKSQMNKILADMENKEYIQRFRSKIDRRSVEIKITEKGIYQYNICHEKALEVVELLTHALGEEKAANAADCLNETANAVKKILDEKGVLK